MAVFLFCGQVYAKGLFTNDKVNFRKSPSLSAEIIETLPPRVRVTETEALADGWSAVIYNGSEGFIFSEYLGSRDAVTSDKVNFRKAPSLNAEIIETLPIGTRVTETEALADGWSAVVYNGSEGFIFSEYLLGETPSRDVVTLDKVNFRKAPSLDADIIETLSAGTSVKESFKLDEGWSAVSYGGVDGYIFNEYLGSRETYNNSLSVGAIKASETPKSETARSDANVTYNEVAASGVELLDWGTAKGLFTIGVDALVTDVWTGKQYYVRSFSNGNHADVEPVTEADTQTMLATYGGVWSWNTRPIWVTINGRTLAASINGMPHGGGVNNNNGMNGQICIHFRGSRTHNGNKSHENDHQASVTAAWNAAN